MKIEGNLITAEKGKVLRRISDQQIFGTEISLGYTYYINNKELKKPLRELSKHYEEIDAPLTDEEAVSLSKVFVSDGLEIVATKAEIETIVEETEKEPEKKSFTFLDIYNMQKELLELKQKIASNEH